MKTALSLSALAPLYVAVAEAQSLVGYGAGTTGGGSTAAITVSDCASFKSAVSGNNAKVIRVNGMLSGCNIVSIGSNTSILGVGSGSGFTNSGLKVQDATNVIVRNLKLGPPTGGSDAITIQSSTYVWIDHNELLSTGPQEADYDGLLDITHGSDFVTVSYNYIHDHNKVSLVGHSDDNSAEDTGHLRVTYHHNYFNNINQRLPSLRFGTGHVYNNYYNTCTQSGINQRMGANILAEYNYFNNCNKAMMNNIDSANSGDLCNRGNTLAGSSTTSLTRTACNYTPPYSYSADSVSAVQSDVRNNAGVGKISV